MAAEVRYPLWGTGGQLKDQRSLNIKKLIKIKIKNLCLLQVHKDFLLEVLVLAFIFMSMIHFESIFVYGVRQRSMLILWVCVRKRERGRERERARGSFLKESV